jgi:hypothetical protein
MTTKQRIAQARTIKDSLDFLHKEALAANLGMVAHMIGCAAEAAAEEINRAPPLLRLVKTGRED